MEARELSIRVKTNENFVPGENQKPISDRKRRNNPASTAATFVTRQRTFTGNSSSKFEVICVFCNKPHYSASCEVVKNVNRRKEILLRYARCLVCLKKGHGANMCERPNCRNCKKRHQSLCDQRKLHNAADASLGAGSSISRQSQEIVSRETATTQTEEDDVITATSVSSRTTIVLQTATALTRGEHGTLEVEIRILFDCGNQKTYVTSERRGKVRHQTS